MLVAGPGITVVLQGLSINGTGGNNGINFSQGKELHVINCAISNFAANGILATATGAKMFVSDTVVRDSASGASYVTGSVTAIVERARIENNGSAGIRAADGPALSVRESAVVNESYRGLCSGEHRNDHADDPRQLAAHRPFRNGQRSQTATDAGSLATLQHDPQYEHAQHEWRWYLFLTRVLRPSRS